MTYDPRWGQAFYLDGTELAPGIVDSSLESVGILDELQVSGSVSIGPQAPTINADFRIDRVTTAANGVAAGTPWNNAGVVNVV